MTPVERSELEALRLEMTASFSRLEGKLEAYVQAHGSVHMNEQAAYNEHLRVSAVGLRDLDDVKKLEPRVEVLEDWRIQVTTAGTLLKVIFGASIVSAAVGIAGLAKLLGLI